MYMKNMHVVYFHEIQILLLFSVYTGSFSPIKLFAFYFHVLKSRLHMKKKNPAAFLFLSLVYFA